MSPPVSFKGFGQAFDSQAFDGQAFDALMKERSTPSCGNLLTRLLWSAVASSTRANKDNTLTQFNRIGSRSSSFG
jgi:hypothetical protein